MLVIGSEAQALGVTPVDGPGRDYVRTYVGTYVHTGEVAVRPTCLWEKERCGPPTARCASTYPGLAEYVWQERLALIAAARDQQRMDPCPPLFWTAIRPVWQASPQPVLAGHL